jgi:hypothetical protein
LSIALIAVRDSEGRRAYRSPIALPPDPEVFAELTALRWKLTARGIQIELKELASLGFVDTRTTTLSVTLM